MFHNIPESILKQMRRLEEIDAKDRIDGTEHLKRLRQIPPETGRFLAILAASAPRGDIIEIGTSAGYSTLYLALACLIKGAKLTTFEVLDNKVSMAKETFELAGVNDVVSLVKGDAREHIGNYNDIAFCFLDAEKDIYSACYDMVIPGMKTGGIFAADNVISHKEALSSFVDKVLTDTRVDTVVVPIGKGILLALKI